MKGLLEEAQRKRRKEMEKAMLKWDPVWFKLDSDPIYPTRKIYQFKACVRMHA